MCSMADCYFSPTELFGALKQLTVRKSEAPASTNKVTEGTNKLGKKSFAEAVHGGSPSLPLEKLPKAAPVKINRVGNLISVTMDERAYAERLASYRNLLLGKIYYKKGDSPLKSAGLRQKLENSWGIKLKKFVDLGKSWFQLAFNTEEEMNQAWSHGSLNLNPGVLRLQPWCADFDPETHKTTNVQVWVRFYLNWIYWHPKILSDLARAVGVPLRIDGNTLHGEYGRYARLLVDINLTEELPEMILMNREGKELEVPLWYENLPSYCQECKSIGHQRSSCNKLVKDHFNAIPAVSQQGELQGNFQPKVWRKKDLSQEVNLAKAGEKTPSPEIMSDKGEAIKEPAKTQSGSNEESNPVEKLASAELESATFAAAKGESSRFNERIDLTHFHLYNAYADLANEDIEENI